MRSSAQETIKCLTPEILQRHLKAKSELKGIYATVRPVLQTSVLTPGGKFRLHFDTTGTNEPAMILSDGTTIPHSWSAYVDTVSKILDIVWKTEIDSFGFKPPPSDNGRGGGNELDVYIEHLGPGTFGYTDWDEDNDLTPGKVNPQYSAFIHIDNAFGIGYRTKGIPAIMATCAHEFHHTIEIGNSGIWNSDFYFYEMSAESMESTVFPEARDYLFDISAYFNNTKNIPLFLKQGGSTPYYGYERAIFCIFFMRRYNPHFMQTVWDQIATDRPVQALQNAYATRSSRLEDEYVEFTKWNYYTGERGDSIDYYPDALRFPPLGFSYTTTLPTSPETIAQSLKSFATSYIRVIVQNDTSDVDVANLNYSDALNEQNQTFPFVLTVSSLPFSGGKQVTSSLYSSLSIPDPLNWNISAFGATTPPFVTTAKVFPNPFNPDNTTVLISTDQKLGSTVGLTIVSSSMDRIYHAEVAPRTFLGKTVVEWNGKDDKGRTVATGVYVYILGNDASSLQKGKIAVIR